jgi:hypothetical protein
LNKESTSVSEEINSVCNGACEKDMSEDDA